VSHDLRTPLRAMFGFSQALYEDFSSPLPPQGREYARRIMEATQRMDTLITDLLEYSRLSRSEIPLDAISLDRVFRQALRDLEVEVKERKAQVHLPGDLPSVRGHEVTLVQLVANLLSNAIKFVAPGVKPVVRITAERRSNRVRVWVEDNGIGIDPVHHDRIFRIFERLNRSEVYPGTGIGLAIVRKAAARMGGEAGVESDGRQGSRFWFELETVEGTP